MKMKSLAVALISLATASFLAATPALAEDASGPSMSTPSDSGMPAQNNANGSENVAGMSDGTAGTAPNNNADTNSSDANDEASPDTATGDDDY